MKAIRIYRHGIHLGEERIIDGNQSSGMITFSGCHLTCNFCYTPETSVHHLGIDHNAASFVELVDELVLRGARNLNLISPTHLWPQLKKPLLDVKLRYGRLLPIILKISGFESPAVIDQMAGFADIFVPDFKVWGENEALKVSLPRGYGRIAQAAVSRMMRTHGSAHYTADGRLTHGMLVRHLMMPNFFDDSLALVSALGDVGFKGHLNFMTYFLDPTLKKVVNASPAEVELLGEAAVAQGIQVLVNGRESAPRPVRSAKREGVSDGIR